METTTIPKNFVYHWGGHFMYLGRFEDVTEHAHHALQIIFNRSGRFQLGVGECSIECGGAIIGADRRHQLLSSSDSQVHIWIDKEATAAKMISAQHLREENIKILDGSLLKQLQACVTATGNYLGACAEASAVYRKIVFELAGSSGHSGEPINPRILSTIHL